MRGHAMQVNLNIDYIDVSLPVWPAQWLNIVMHMIAHVGILLGNVVEISRDIF